MGLVESTLIPATTRPLVRPEMMAQLPSFSLDSAKFTDGSTGFVVTRVDLAKNTNTKTIALKFYYKPSDTRLVFVGQDESIVTFEKDIATNKVICRVEVVNQPPIIRQCVSTYEPIDNLILDHVGDLYRITLPN
jgi:hypothetical protein